MKIIGLTGGIGSGKSTVTDYLVTMGFHVLDADKIARELVMPGSDMLIQLKRAEFGDDILLDDGSLNRKKLGSIVFSDEKKKQTLDKMMHTKILEIIHDRILKIREESRHFAVDVIRPETAAKHRVIFIDAPLLFETGLDNSVEEVWVIDVDDETRINRIMERDGLNRNEIIKIMNSQMARSEKNRRADVLLDNSGKREVLYRQLDQLIQKI